MLLHFTISTNHFDTILEILTPETTLHAAKKLKTLYNQFIAILYNRYSLLYRKI